MDFKTAYKLACKANAQILEIEAQLLYGLIIKDDMNTVVEIGSWHGGSTVVLASAIQEGNKGRVYAVDPFKGYVYDQKDVSRGLKKKLRHVSHEETFSKFMKNINEAKMSEWIIPMKGSSEEMCKIYTGGPIDLLFIDGNHDEMPCRLDFALWEPLVKIGGYILFHDTDVSAGFYGPDKVAREVFSDSTRFVEIDQVGTIRFGKKII